MTKINEKIKKQIKELREAGKTFKDIAYIIGVSPSTVQYHAEKKYEIKAKARAIDWFNKNVKDNPKKKREIYSKRKEYNKTYMRKRYKSDETFRNKHIKRVKRSRKNVSRKNY